MRGRLLLISRVTVYENLAARQMRLFSAAPLLTQLEIEKAVNTVVSRNVQQDLKLLEKPTITVNQYLDIAKGNGLSPDDSMNLLKAMGDCGQILHFGDSSDESLRQQIFLNLDELAAVVQSQVHLSRKETLEAQVTELESALEHEKKHVEVIDKKAAMYANLVTYGGLGILCVQFVVFFDLVWFTLSWDIMEPIVFFFGQFNALLAYLYFIAMKQDHSLEGMWSNLYASRRKSLMTREGIDFQKTLDLETALSTKKALLRSHKK
jgi:hypothetical protein